MFVFFCKVKDMSFLKRNQLNESSNTEKTTSRRRRKRTEATMSDNCRLCGSCFKMQFGNFKPGWITTENIFTAPQRKAKMLPMVF